MTTTNKGSKPHPLGRVLTDPRAQKILPPVEYDDAESDSGERERRERGRRPVSPTNGLREPPPRQAPHPPPDPNGRKPFK